MYLIPKDADEHYRPKLESLIAESSIEAWEWESSEPLQEIPSPAHPRS